MTPDERSAIIAQLEAADKAVVKCKQRMAELWDPDEAAPEISEAMVERAVSAGIRYGLAVLDVALIDKGGE